MSSSWTSAVTQWLVAVLTGCCDIPMKGCIQRVSQPSGMLGIGRGDALPSGVESGFRGNLVFGCLCQYFLRADSKYFML